MYLKLLKELSIEYKLIFVINLYPTTSVNIFCETKHTKSIYMLLFPPPQNYVNA